MFGRNEKSVEWLIRSAVVNSAELKTAESDIDHRRSNRRWYNCVGGTMAYNA